MALTDTELMAAWRAGNDAGRGFPIGNVDGTPEEAAEDGGLEDVRRISPEGAVVGHVGLEVLVIADCNGPWAVSVGTVGNEL